MKSRILSIALAMCMLAVVFTALPSKGAVYYTGTVQTTDDAGEAKDVFFRGDWIYVNVELMYEGVLVDADIRVDIVDQNGIVRDSIFAATDDPAVGHYNSSEAVVNDWLNTNNVPMPGDMTVCDIVLSLDFWPYTEVVREQIVLKEDGLSLDPPPMWYYYPGQVITITLSTSYPDPFYVEILNETYDQAEDGLWQYQEVDESGVWTDEWTVPIDAKDGLYTIEVRDEDTDALLYWEEFYVAMYVIVMNTDRYNVLPGEDVLVDYLVVDMATLALYDDVSVEWTAQWYDMDGELQEETGVLTPGYLGDEIFTIPADINLTSYYDIYFWANDSQERSTSYWLEFSIGQLDGDVDTDQNSYVAGEVVTVEVSAFVSWDDLPEADVDIVVEKDGEVLTEFGASGLTTGREGTVEHEFVLGNDADEGTYIVAATISKVGYTVERLATFEVDLDYGFEVDLNRDAYYSGEAATVTFTTYWGIEQVVNNSVLFIVSSDVGTEVVGNTTAGEAVFAVPLNYVGWIYVEAVTTVNGYVLDDTTSAWVQKAYIALAPVADTYAGGDTVQWNFEILTAMESAMISYEVRSAGGDVVQAASPDFVTSGSVSYTVPVSDPSSHYTLTLTVKDGQGNNVEESSTVDLVPQYKISVWLAGDSGYKTGAFVPGAEIQLEYEITSSADTEVSIYKIRFYSTTDSSVYWYILTSEMTGTLTVTVPDDVPDGTYSVQIALLDGITDAWLSSDYVPFAVAGGQSTWDKEVAGMSMIDFTILVLIVVMIVLLIVVPFLKGRTGKPAAPETTMAEPEVVETPPEPPQSPPEE